MRSYGSVFRQVERLP